ncbi:MAG: 4-alpha-glucanotransferase [Bradymonadaceae bacterium]|nr:4-alpha-glucanotransferase [Lujinxingiaceae bacterium]
MKIPRSSGILLHPTSLPGAYGVGCLGLESRKFLDKLEQAGQRWWQILPLNPPGHGGSPYSAISAFAGNPVMVDLEDLGAWITPEELEDFRRLCAALPADRFAIDTVTAAKTVLLNSVHLRWKAADHGTREAHASFCKGEAGWLDDYSLFVAIKAEQDGLPWYEWPAEYVQRDAATLEAARTRLGGVIEQIKFAQWLFFDQWTKLRAEAAERGVKFIGDVPIFVSMDSVDAWANRHLFELDANGQAQAVAGVPPDYFSETGQRWGNPLYNWAALSEQGYAWWIARVQKVLDTVDLVRIDHFRGFAAYWRVPAEEATAMNGTWVEGPRDAFFEAIRSALGEVPFIAEDLGLITDDVFELRDRQGLPGMKVVHFAFDGTPDHPFLPHTYPENSVAYSGTHDNDTTQGWYDKLDELERHAVRSYFRQSDDTIVIGIIDSLLASRASLVVFPAQDLFELGSGARMNTPGLSEGNWDWRMTADMLGCKEVWRRLGELTRQHGR